MPKVKVYSTQTCPWCAKTREFLNKHKINFTDVDVGSDREAAKEMVQKSHQLGVPVIDIDGKIIVGYDEDKLRKLLGVK